MMGKMATTRRGLFGWIAAGIAATVVRPALSLPQPIPIGGPGDTGSWTADAARELLFRDGDLLYNGVIIRDLPGAVISEDYACGYRLYTTIPFDSSIPLGAEGDEVLSQAIR